MNQEKTTQTNTPSELNLLSVSVKRTLNGAKLNLKSDSFESFFKNRTVSNDELIKNRDGKILNFYTCPNFSDRDIQRKINQCDAILRNYDGFLNAGFLRTVGLSKGVSIDINGVYNKSALMSFVNDMKLFARDFYLEYMCEDNISVEVVIKENKV